MPKLTDSQLVILSAAAHRDGHAIPPLPKSIKLNKGAAALVLKSLVRQGLATERPASSDEAVWRDADGERLALAVTEAGLAAIGAEPANPTKTKPAKAGGDVDTKPKPRPSRPTAPIQAQAKKPSSSKVKARPGTKLALLIDLLGRKGGTTIENMTKATGWQRHSVRGAISGALKKKLGLVIANEAIDGRGRIFRIATRG